MTTTMTTTTKASRRDILQKTPQLKGSFRKYSSSKTIASSTPFEASSSGIRTSTSGLAHHDGLELLVVDGAGSVLVNLVNHLVDISFRHCFIQSQQDLLQDCSVNGALALLIQNSESLSDFLLFLGLFGLLGHQNQKLIKVDESRTVTVNLFNTFLELVWFELMPQHSHDGTQLACGDFPSSFLVYSLESIFEVSHLRVGQLVLWRLCNSFVTHFDDGKVIER